MVTTEVDTMDRTSSQVQRFAESNIYPLDKNLIYELAADMSKNGFDGNFPILIKEIGGVQQIVDGWHRYKASQLAGVDPAFKEFTGSNDGALMTVLRANGNRRHLSPGQKVASALLVNLRLEGDPLNADEISKYSGLAAASVNRYRTYTPEELEKIVAGQTARELEGLKKKGKGKGKTKSVSHIANVKEVRRLAGLSAATGKSVKDILKEIVENGLTAMEQKLDQSSNGV